MPTSKTAEVALPPVEIRPLRRDKGKHVLAGSEVVARVEYSRTARAWIVYDGIGRPIPVKRDGFIVPVLAASPMEVTQPGFFRGLMKLGYLPWGEALARARREKFEQDAEEHRRAVEDGEAHRALLQRILRLGLHREPKPMFGRNAA